MTSSTFQCPNNETLCVNSIRECKMSIFSNYCGAALPFYCKVNNIYDCVNRLYKCDCPENYTKCSLNNKCLPNKNYSFFCNPYNFSNISCPDSFPYKCSDGNCRKTFNDCPSQMVCPIGYFLCPNNECKLYKNDCQNINFNCQKTLCPFDLTTCVDNITECPTAKTCLSKTNIVCPDGKCVESEELCLSPPPSFYIQSISCGVYKVLCEDNVCREICGKTLNPYNVNLLKIFIKCPLNQIKCPDNSCKNQTNDCINLSCGMKVTK